MLKIFILFGIIFRAVVTVVIMLHFQHNNIMDNRNFIIIICL